MPPHPAALPEAELLASCDLVRTRRGGPGGQHRNKVETAIVITHRPSGVFAEASERRSQAENRRVAIHRLRVRLALALRHSPPHRAITDSAAAVAAVSGSSPDQFPPQDEAAVDAVWAQYRRAQRLVISPRNPDYPGVLAAALDHLFAARFDPGAAAAELQISSSQLLKLIQSEPAAWSWLQDHRQKAGLKALHSR